MGANDDIERLLKEAALAMKGDVRGAISKLESAHEIARKAGHADDQARVAEELSRAWSRRKSSARSLHYARSATKVMPERKAAWNTLGKTCELLATRTSSDRKRGRAGALYKAAASAFKKAATLTKDPEDKRWLLELASDAKRIAGSLAPKE